MKKKISYILTIVVICLNIGFGSPPELETIAPIASGDGKITIRYITDAFGNPIPQYSFNSNEFTELPMPDSQSFGVPTEISADGRVINGQFYYKEPSTSRIGYWKQVNEIGGIPMYESYIYELPFGSTWSASSDMSLNGKYVVGSAGNSNNISSAYLWDVDGSVISLGNMILNEVSSSVDTGRAVSNNKIVVGRCLWPHQDNSNTYESRAFIWNETKGLSDMKEFLESGFGYNFGNNILTDCYYINSNGTALVGDGVDENGQWFNWSATIPEPGTMVLLGLGGLFLRKKVS